MHYIETLREGERVNEIYLCKNKQSALTKAGKPYEALILQDKTGTLDAKIWEPGSVGIDDFDRFDYINVVGDITSFQGALQLNVKRVRKAAEGEYEPKEYLPVSEYNVDEMYEQLLGYIKQMKNPYLKKLAGSFFIEDADFAKRFKFHSAAKSVHHGFVGGLLEHTLSVTKLSAYFADNYKILNKDLLVCAAMFHDIGKLEELSTFPENDYTDEECAAYSLEKQVTEDTVPHFIWQTEEDDCVCVENSLVLAEALIARRIPTELHIYPKGPHGMSVATKEVYCNTPQNIDPHVGSWVKAAVEWTQLI